MERDLESSRVGTYFASNIFDPSSILYERRGFKSADASKIIRIVPLKLK
jgi:hypothetical protein